MKENTQKSSKEKYSKLSKDDLKSLDQALKQKMSEIQSMDLSVFEAELDVVEKRNFDVSKGLSEEEVFEEFNAIRKDIATTYSTGLLVKLASSFQTYPLISFFKSKDVEIPPEINTLFEKSKYDFYLLEVNFSSSLEKNIYLKQAELKVTISDNVDKKERKSRFFKIYPENAYQKYFSANFKGKVGIDANLEFKFEIPEIPEVLKVGIKPVAELGTSVVWDLGEKTFRKAKIETLGEKDMMALWRYYMTSGEYKNDDYVSTAIMQIPREAKKVKIKAELNVTPYKSIWGWFDQILPPIPVAPEEKEVELISAHE